MTHTMTRTATSALAVVFAVAMVLAFAGTADAYSRRGGDDGTSVSNSNSAHVTNTATTRANTGRNDANGGAGDNGGDSGNARGGNASTGKGGNGGNGGDAGTIKTGPASSFGMIVNDINRNSTVIEDDCGCDQGRLSRFFRGNDDESTSVRNSNRARVNNTQTTSANTGDNVVDGGDAGDGGASGDASSRTRHHRLFFLNWWGGNNDASTGNGGNGGHGGAGGSITSGEAYADGYISNVVNRNTTRIERGGGLLAI